MYIPHGVSDAGGGGGGGGQFEPRAPTSWHHPAAAGLPAAHLTRRQFSDDPLENTNISIGVTVGVTLAAFFAGVCAFLWVYRHTIRCSPSRRSRRRKSSKSSKASSHHGSEAAEAAPAAEGEAPAAEAEAAPAAEAEAAPA